MRLVRCVCLTEAAASEMEDGISAGDVGVAPASRLAVGGSDWDSASISSSGQSPLNGHCSSPDAIYSVRPPLGRDAKNSDE